MGADMAFLFGVDETSQRALDSGTVKKSYASGQKFGVLARQDACRFHIRPRPDRSPQGVLDDLCSPDCVVDRPGKPLVVGDDDSGSDGSFKMMDKVYRLRMREGVKWPFVKFGKRRGDLSIAAGDFYDIGKLIHYDTKIWRFSRVGGGTSH
jgi:hypothetical protein